MRMSYAQNLENKRHRSKILRAWELLANPDPLRPDHEHFSSQGLDFRAVVCNLDRARL
jgi:hypothetical protein